MNRNVNRDKIPDSNMNRPSNNMPERPGHPVRANYLISGVTPEEVFDALLRVERFAEWSYGLSWSRIVGGATEVVPGTVLQFGLSALGLTHEVESEIIIVEAPRLLEWRYVSGALGDGGWLIEEAGPLSVRMTLSTDYHVKPVWLDRIANRPFIHNVVQDLLRRSVRRFGEQLKKQSPS